MQRIMLAAQEDTGYKYFGFLAAEDGVIMLLKIQNPFNLSSKGAL